MTSFGTSQLFAASESGRANDLESARWITDARQMMLAGPAADMMFLQGYPQHIQHMLPHERQRIVAQWQHSESRAQSVAMLKLALSRFGFGAPAIAVRALPE
eukprot:CAMPEP_0176158908 /NCGR_PEP_ID=MMETSP0120_2-20121206/81284_1 /TAXON_ID=160619 /ORGANISM="Kryptoperidinium foliaceum, Strain CCMP 1326" /LENGTH=101 /DNA_ID=CAMNT_0017496301 /DNA_START=53 /DNA_END=355 /DNA_ORIENTATION=+